MFMTCVQLSSNDYKMVRSTCRSAMMKYRSEPVRSLERYFIWPAQLTGYSDEKQSVHIPLLDDFLDDPLNPAIRLQFQVFLKTFAQILPPLILSIFHFFCTPSPMSAHIHIYESALVDCFRPIYMAICTAVANLPKRGLATASHPQIQSSSSKRYVSI